MYTLKPIHDGRKSFYGKAIIQDNDDGSKTLLSYGTPVVTIWPYSGSVEFTAQWDCSQTTLRHVKEFLQQAGFFSGSAREMKSYYDIKE